MVIADIIKKRKAQNQGPSSAQSIAQRQQRLATGKSMGTQVGPAMSNIAAQTAAQSGQAQQAAQQFQTAQAASGLAQQQQQGDQAFAAAQRQQQRQFGVQEQGLLAEGQIQMQQRDAQDQMASQQLKQSEQQAREKLNNQYANGLAELTSERSMVENQVFQGLEFARKTLASDVFNAGVEQLGHMLAMSDRAYLDEITRVGQMHNLRDEIAFKREATELAFGQDLEILRQQFDIQALINADARETRLAIQDMSDNTAWQLAEQAAQEEAYKNVIQGISAGSKAAAGADWGGGEGGTLTGASQPGPLAGGTYGPTSSGPAYQDPTSSGGSYSTPNTGWGN